MLFPWRLPTIDTLMIMLICVLYLSSVIEGYVVEARGDEQTKKEETEPITCYTCPNKTNNEECNEWAPEEYCAVNHTICHTVHRINTVTGKSVYVNKRCALPTECTHEMIGCHQTGLPNVKECISCCNSAYCNKPVPSNHTTALLYSTLTNSAVRTVLDRQWIWLWTATFLCSLLTQRTSWRKYKYWLYKQYLFPEIISKAGYHIWGLKDRRMD